MDLFEFRLHGVLSPKVEINIYDQTLAVPEKAHK